MKKYLKSFITNSIFSGSLVMIVGSNATNFINYLYHLIMGRMLGPISYGELATLISILGLISMIPFALGLVVVKFVSSAKSDQEIESLIHFLSKKILFLGLGLFILIWLLSFELNQFLHLNNPLLLVLMGAIFIVSLPALFYRAILQGLLKFNQLVISTLAENLARLLLAILAVLLGWGIVGVIGTLILSAGVGLITSQLFTKRIRIKMEENIAPKLKPILLYSLPVLIQSITMTSLYSSDLILVKHFFSATDSGLYAALSNLGKIIFFGAGPIAAVMFPMVAKRKAHGESYKRVFTTSLVLTTLFSGGILLFYDLFPELAIKALYGPAYLEVSSTLVWFGLFMTMFTLASLFLSFHLSLGKTKVIILPTLAAILQISLIWFYHPNLIAVIFISLSVGILLVISLGIYSWAIFKK